MATKDNAYAIGAFVCWWGVVCATVFGATDELPKYSTPVMKVGDHCGETLNVGNRSLVLLMRPHGNSFTKSRGCEIRIVAAKGWALRLNITNMNFRDSTVCDSNAKGHASGPSSYMRVRNITETDLDESHPVIHGEFKRGRNTSCLTTKDYFSSPENDGLVIDFFGSHRKSTLTTIVTAFRYNGWPNIPDSAFRCDNSKILDLSLAFDYIDHCGDETDVKYFKDMKPKRVPAHQAKEMDRATVQTRALSDHNGLQNQITQASMGKQQVEPCSDPQMFTSTNKPRTAALSDDPAGINGDSKVSYQAADLTDRMLQKERDYSGQHEARMVIVAVCVIVIVLIGTVYVAKCSVRFNEMRLSWKRSRQQNSEPPVAHNGTHNKSNPTEKQEQSGTGDAETPPSVVASELRLTVL